MVAVWQDEEATRCHECQTYPWEWEDGEEVWEPDIDDCEGCRQIDELRERVTSEHRPEMIRGWKLRFFKRGVSNGD